MDLHIHNRSVINNVINNRNPAPAQQFGGTARTGGQQVATPTPSVAPLLPPAAAQRANLVQPSPQPGGGQPGRQAGGQPGLGGKPAAPTTATPPPGAPANATAARTNPAAAGVPAAAAPVRMRGRVPMDNRCQNLQPRPPWRRRHCSPNLPAQEPSHHQLPRKQTPAVQTTAVPPAGGKIQGGAPAAPAPRRRRDQSENLKPAGTPPVAPGNHTRPRH